MKHMTTLTSTVLPTTASLLETSQKAAIIGVLATASNTLASAFNTYLTAQDRKDA